MVKDIDNKVVLKLLLETYQDKIGRSKKISELFKKYSPWKSSNKNKVIDSFINALTINSNNFTWLNIENNLPKSKDISINYGIPNHIKGNINEATLFLCLVNPNIDKVKVKKIDGVGIYYKKARELNSGDKSLNIVDDSSKFIQNRDFLTKHIVDVSKDSSILFNELEFLQNKLLDNKNSYSKKDAYYLEHYLPHFIKEFLGKKGSLKDIIENLKEEEWKELKKMSKKIANLEAFPFRSQNPNFTKKECKKETSFTNLLIESDSKVNLLSARIIIWRIVKYLESPKTKPIFIFRRFNTFWYNSLLKVLLQDLNITSEEAKKIILVLEDEYFYTVRKKEYDGQTGYFGRNFCKNNEKIKDDKFKILVKETLGKYVSKKDN